MKIAWLTDIHLNFLLERQADAFLESLERMGAAALLIGGDIAEAQNVCEYLERIEAATEAPVYFVLGNHDYYHGSIVEVRQRVVELCAARPRLHYLTRSGVESLSDAVGLVGHDGWADGRLGNYLSSMVMMHDFKLIAELAGRTKKDRWEVLKALGDEAAEHFRRVLPEALEKHEQVYLLTHVPPFAQACWHAGRISDDQWMPHFTCHAAGQAILEIMAARPDRRLTVLCGHTHGQGETRPLANLHVITGGAEYGHPMVQQVFELK